MHRLENNKHVVSIVSRSQGHFTKMLKALIKAIRAHEFRDESFNEYECNYVFTMDGSDDDINDYIENMNNERNQQENDEYS